MTIPADFHLTYEWVAGSMPPPYHYEYKVILNSNGEGTILLIPDYDFPGVPTWQETFTVTPGQLESLILSLRINDLLREKWRKPTRHTVGGDQAWLRLVLDGKSYSIPPTLNRRDSNRAEMIYDIVRKLVPAGIWESLLARRQEYEDNYSRGK